MICSMFIGKVQQVAVIGAGLAEASCARALLRAGRSARVFDKSRGPGGHLAVCAILVGGDAAARIRRGAIVPGTRRP